MFKWPVFIFFGVMLFSGCSVEHESGVEFSYQTYLDESREQSVEQYEKIPFTKSTDLDLGLYRGDLWILVRVSNTSEKRKSFVIFNQDVINTHYAFYDINESGKPILRRNSGFIQDSRSYHIPKPNFIVDLKPFESKSYLIYTTCDGRGVKATLSILSMKKFMKHMENDLIKTFFFYGAAFIMLLINLSIGLLLRQRLNLVYSLYIIVASVFYLGLEGYFFNRGIDNTLVDQIMWILVRVMIFSLSYFSFSLFESKRTAPRMFRIAKWYLIFALGIPTILQLTSYSTFTMKFQNAETLLHFVSLAIILTTVILSYREKRREVRLYLIGLSSFVIFASIGNYLNVSGANIGEFTSFYKIGAFIEFVVFTFVVVSSQKRTILEKQELQNAIERLTESPRFEKSDLTSMLKLLESNISNDAEWENFKILYQNLDPNFFSNLHQAHPDLNKSELRHLTLLKIGFSKKEIANILGIEMNSVKKAKQRLRKKLGINEDVNINDYLSGF